MPAERAEMRKIREVLRLKHAHQTSERQISFAVGLSRSTIGDYLKRAARARLSWPIPEAIDDSGRPSLYTRVPAARWWLRAAAVACVKFCKISGPCLRCHVRRQRTFPGGLSSARPLIPGW